MPFMSESYTGGHPTTRRERGNDHIARVSFPLSLYDGIDAHDENVSVLIDEHDGSILTDA